MKTLKTIILSLAAVVAFGAASAKNINPESDKMSVNYAVSTYVNALSHGQNNGLNEVIDSNCKLTMLRGKSMLSFDKAQLMESFQTTQNVQQNCTTSIAVNETNTDLTLVTVTMQYAGFTRVNYVTLANTATGWKINNIYSVFKQ
jgi:hypothetical protein